MISGVQRIQQNQKGVITLTYEGGTQKKVPMSDLNLAKCDDFMATFREVWKRLEGLS